MDIEDPTKPVEVSGDVEGNGTGITDASSGL